jgi:hypothetical protein
LKNPATGPPFETFEGKPIRMKEFDRDIMVTFSKPMTV